MRNFLVASAFAVVLWGTAAAAGEEPGVARPLDVVLPAREMADLRDGVLHTFLVRATDFERHRLWGESALINDGEDYLAKVAALMGAKARDEKDYIIAANFYSMAGESKDAERMFAAGLALKPKSPLVLIHRSRHRKETDKVGYRKDIEAVLQSEPRNTEALLGKAGFLADSKAYAGALPLYSAALDVAPKSHEGLLGRGMAYARLGNATAAEADFTAARAVATAHELHDACWTKATAGIVLESALADCNAALQKSPDAPLYVGALGLVFLRMGRLDDAIQSYDRAELGNVERSVILFGRAIAWSRKGEKIKAREDAEAARRIDPKIAAKFQSYGLSLDTPSSQTRS